jgi:ABC-type Na+ transport system ATPase subunit NatA
MPELRGKQATEDVKQEWIRAYEVYRSHPGVPHNQKLDRTERINYVAEVMNLTRKQAKRRVKNFEAWQRNLKKGLVER